jgi:hypothetical protein
VKIRGAAAILLCVLSVTAVVADGAESCSAITVEVPVAAVVASSGFVSNLLGTSSSLSSESNRLIAAACEEITAARPPAGLCPARCAPPEGPLVVVRSTPTAFLEDYSEEALCERRLEETLREPLLFERQTFSSAKEIESWVTDFVRGKGEHGEDLYRMCEGRCSPQYVWIISRDGSDDVLVVDTQVTCGHARDKDVGLYELSYGLRWTCRDATATK